MVCRLAPRWRGRYSTKKDWTSANSSFGPALVMAVGTHAVASEGATARRMQRTAAQLGGTPFTVPDVGLGARRGVQRHLHRRSPPHRRMAPRRRELCGVRRAAVTGRDGVVGGPLRIKPNSG